MYKFFKDRSKTRGQAPASAIFIGEQKMAKSLAHFFQYDEEHIWEGQLENPVEGLSMIEKRKAIWINIDGIHATQWISDIGKELNIHPLHIEDIVTTDQRPKIDEQDNYLFMVAKLLKYENNEIKTEQISFVLGRDYLLTFQEQKGDVFDPVRNRLRKGNTRIRQMKSDYLAYALLDSIIDNYVFIIQALGEKIEAMEKTLLSDPDKTIINEVYHFKIELNYLRKIMLPVKDMTNRLIKSENPLVREETKHFFRDLNDMVTQATDTIETYYHITSDMISIYSTHVGNRMNAVMKTLTIFASVFIPLTFLAGVYGMNFDYLPELHYKYSYPVFWGVILLVGIGMYIYFKKKKFI
jgi:magnesium transporter